MDEKHTDAALQALFHLRLRRRGATHLREPPNPMTSNPDLLDAPDGALTDRMPATAGAPASARPRLLCREMADADIEDVIALLRRGFPARPVEIWRRGLARHADHARPDGCPKWGFVLTANEAVVGVVLTLYTPPDLPGVSGPRCNLASWYVEPAFSLYATLLDKTAMGNGDVTFTNISAARHTIPMHLARGFSRSSAGQFGCVPLLARGRSSGSVKAIAEAGVLDGLNDSDRRTLMDHARYGCVCVVGHDGTTASPFVFRRHPVRYLKWRLGFSPIHYMQVVYCRSDEDLVAFARPLGIHLLRNHRATLVLIDADGPIHGLPGIYRPGMETRLKRGPDTVRHGDLRYSEMAIFGP